MSSDEVEGSMRGIRRINVRHFASLFRGRRDAFGLMQGGKIAAVRRPVTLLHYRLHLEGKIRLGIYPLFPDARTLFLALDFDGSHAWEGAWRVFIRSGHFHLPFVWEASKSGDAHLWLFFSERVAARDARRVAGMLLEESGVKAEIFPKQDTVPEDGLGNFIWLPLSGMSVKEGRTLFVDPLTHSPYHDQRGFLEQIPRVSAATIAGIVEVNGLDGPVFPIPSDSESRRHCGGLLPCARKMLEGVSEGCRDVVAFRLAVHLKANGYSFQQAEQLLQEWNATKNRPPLLPREIAAKVQSAYLRGYSGYGCEDSLIIPFCEEICPVKQKMLMAQCVGGGIPMKEAKRNNGREECAPEECPHCGAGADGETVGLFWDFGDHCWRCVTCGFRVYEHAARPRTQAEIVAEKLWDEVLYALDAEEREPSFGSAFDGGNGPEIFSLG